MIIKTKKLIWCHISKGIIGALCNLQMKQNLTIHYTLSIMKCLQKFSKRFYRSYYPERIRQFILEVWGDMKKWSVHGFFHVSFLHIKMEIICRRSCCTGGAAPCFSNQLSVLEQCPQYTWKSTAMSFIK